MKKIGGIREDDRVEDLDECPVMPMYKWYDSHMRKVRVEDLAGSYEMR